ncbi:MAG: hypothetical protein V3T23_04000 [Nitrososphaerales archaeon]
MPSPSNITEKIFVAIRDLLVTSKTSGTLIYVKNIFEGTREIPNGGFPTIILEPDEVEEQQHTVAGPASKKRIIFRISIHCLVESIELRKSIRGDGPSGGSTPNGIFDLVDDVKNVLDASPKLGLSGENVLWSRYPNTRYFLDNYPVREAIITAQVEATRAQTNR